MDGRLSLLCFVWLTGALTSGYEYSLTHLSTLYLPKGFSGPTPLYQFQSPSAERAVFEATDKIIYVIGKEMLHIVDARTPTNLTYLHHVTMPTKELTDVTTCGGAVFVTFVDKNNLLQGGILQYAAFSREAGAIALTRTIALGTQPEMLTATRNCTLVVALENPAVNVGGRLVDPPGGVGIVRFPEGVENEPHKTTLDFRAFDYRFHALAREGMRWVYRAGNNSLPSDDLEPEYVTLNAAETKAWVSLQENNAVAEVDLVNLSVTSLRGLGFKPWRLGQLDPSDRDGGVHLAPWSVMGMPQPDGLQWFRWAGQDYIVTANEGASKNYRSVSFTESKQGRRFSSRQLAASVTPRLRQALRNSSQLGRLLLSKVDGKDEFGKFRAFYAYGSRSFSVWRASDMQLIFDSNSELSEKVASLRPELFNNAVSGRDATRTIAAGRDRASTDKGPEPKSVAMASMSNGDQLLFVGLENPGCLAVYSLPRGFRRLRPQFQSLYTDGIPAAPANATWGDLYRDRRLHAVDPESIVYLSPDSGLADYPLLLVAGSGSGTVTLLKVKVSGSPSGAAASSLSGGGASLLGALVSAMVVITGLAAPTV